MNKRVKVLRHLFFSMQKHDGYAWPVVDHDNDGEMIYSERVYCYLNTSQYTSNSSLYSKNWRKKRFD